MYNFMYLYKLCNSEGIWIPVLCIMQIRLCLSRCMYAYVYVNVHYYCVYS